MTTLTQTSQPVAPLMGLSRRLVACLGGFGFSPVYPEYENGEEVAQGTNIRSTVRFEQVTSPPAVWVSAGVDFVRDELGEGFLSEEWYIGMNRVQVTSGDESSGILAGIEQVSLCGVMRRPESLFADTAPRTIVSALDCFRVQLVDDDGQRKIQLVVITSTFPVITTQTLSMDYDAPADGIIRWSARTTASQLYIEINGVSATAAISDFALNRGSLLFTTYTLRISARAVSSGNRFPSGCVIANVSIFSGALSLPELAYVRRMLDRVTPPDFPATVTDTGFGFDFGFELQNFG